MDAKCKEVGAVDVSIPSAKDLKELHERVLTRVREMTPKEGFQSLIASGIYTSDGKLAKEYGG